AKALAEVGKVAAAIALDRRLIGRAEAIRHAPLVAIARAQLATAETSADDFAASLAELDRAIPAAAEAHEDALEAQDWLLSLFDLEHLGRYRDALAVRLA